VTFVAAFGSDGARYVALREVPFDKDAEVSWDGFVRRYNADLANDFGNLVNRTVSMVNRYPHRRASVPIRRPRRRTASRGPGSGCLTRSSRSSTTACCHRALETIMGVVGEANRRVDAEKPWELAKTAKAGDADAATRLSAVLGDLVEAWPADRAGNRPLPARHGATRARPARICLAVRPGWQRRAAAARRAPLGRPRRRGGNVEQR